MTGHRSTSVLLLNHSDAFDGASRAAYRLHKALLANGISSQMRVARAQTGDWTVQPGLGRFTPIKETLRLICGEAVSMLQRTNNSGAHSTALLPSAWPTLINNTDVDLVHLHWINREMLSIEDIAQINKPVVWTLHDMWAFCGAEHYTESMRWREGYMRSNRAPSDNGLDINRWVWNRKRRSWKRPFHIVTPSQWLADCVQSSALMHDWPVHVIPNPIDVDMWTPVDKRAARRLMQLPEDVPLLAFGAVGGVRDPRKGFDLLQQALPLLRRDLPELQLLIFGQLAPRDPPRFGFTAHYSGHLYDDLSMRILYSAADVFVIPSRQDNLPNTGLEALSCGTPVVAFSTGGLSDIVQHGVNGYLSTPFNPESLAAGINWIVGDSARHRKLCNQARADAVLRYSRKVVADQYGKVYEAALGDR